jgi:hypothetical protein
MLLTPLAFGETTMARLHETLIKPLPAAVYGSACSNNQAAADRPPR